MVVKEKILLTIPALYSELIYNNLTSLCRNRTEFILRAIEEKFERERIEYLYKELSSFKGDIEDMPLKMN